MSAFGDIIMVVEHPQRTDDIPTQIMIPSQCTHAIPQCTTHTLYNVTKPDIFRADRPCKVTKHQCILKGEFRVKYRLGSHERA